MGSIRYTLRQWRRDPQFVAIAVIVLALGIGANTAIFSVIDGVLISEMAYPEAGRLVQIGRTITLGFSSATTPAQILFTQRENRSFSALAGYDGLGTGMNLSTDAEPERVSSFRVTDEFFDVLATPAQLGRDFGPEDGLEGSPKVAVISDGLWRRVFGADPGILGRNIRLNGESHAVIGVMQRGFDFYNSADVWTPLPLNPEDGSAIYYIVARLKDGVTLENAASDLRSVQEEFRKAYPEGLGQGQSLVVRPYQDQIVGDLKTPLYLLLGAVGLVLLIACSNVANLLLARANARRQELALRRALGAGRGRLVRQLLTESLVLAAAGGVLGLVLTYWLLATLVSLRPENLPRIDNIGIDLTVLGFTGLLTLATGVLFGVLPAMQASREDPQEALREGAVRASSGRAGGRARSILMVGEVALALVLLVGAGLLFTSLNQVIHRDPGFGAEGLLTMKMSLGGPEAVTTAGITEFTRRVVDQMKALPGVESAATVSTLPLEHGLQTLFDVEGRPNPDPTMREGRAQWRLVSPGYFETMQIQLQAGRDFGFDDTVDSPPVVIVNRALAERYFPGENPVGQRLLTGRAGSDEAPDTIIGVVGDISEVSLDRPPEATVFQPTTQASDGLTASMASFIPTCWVVRTSGDPLAFVPEIRRAILTVDGEQPVSDVRSMEQLLARSLSRRQFSTLLLIFFSGLALVLAAVGVYGVISYSVSRRTREIGIRAALGAGRGDTLWLVFRQVLVLCGAGIAVGLAAAWTMSGVLEGFLVGVGAVDFTIFTAAAFLLALTALCATAVPARRALGVEPSVALRCE